MNKKSTRNRNIFQIILCIVVLALIVTVILQSRRINILSKKGNDTSMPEDVSAGLKVDNTATEDISESQAKIRTSENKTDQIDSDLKFTEDLIKDAKDEFGSAQANLQSGNLIENLSSMIQENPVMENMVRIQLKSGLLESYSLFVEEQNLSDDIKNSLIDLLVEKQLETVDMASQIGELQRGNVTGEDLREEMEYLNNTYDEKISDLLSPGEFAAYKEYSEVEPERMILNEFKKNMEFTGGMQLNKQQEKDMVAAMYNERKELAEIQNGNQQTTPFQNALSEENFKNSIAIQNRLFNGYLEASKNILSESQQKNFKMFIDSRKSMLEMGAELAPKLLGISEEGGIK